MLLLATVQNTQAMGVDTTVVLIDATALEQRVIPALSDFLDRDDPSAVKLLVQETLASEQFQHALTNDKVIAEYFAKGSQDLIDGRIPNKIRDFSQADHWIVDRREIKQRLAQETLNRFLVLIFAAGPWEPRQPRVNFNRGAFADYIRARSPWMDEMLALSNEFLWDAQHLEPGFGGDEWLLTTGEAEKLLKAVREVPRPTSDAALIDQYDTLIKMLETAVREPRYRILIEMG